MYSTAPEKQKARKDVIRGENREHSTDLKTGEIAITCRREIGGKY
jgi:hypothetical protein